ncbi:hypothetical protein DY000_02041392 [Brassica cretica]|uniref:Uncharacterized protein n=1 Tax=Brassica cretica TaxID=69181 RepID=A0ABQ7BEE1_BRACR|nr:hypothetical protein DY000_02041392 [Brassica cretica]
MSSKSRLSRKEKGKVVATFPSPASVSPLDEFDLIHLDALRDTENMSLSQRLLVADSHRQTREEAAGRIEASGDSGTSGSRNSGEDRSDASIDSERSGSEASSRAPRPSRRVHRRAIATHSHLRWPDLSREWIRRQQARIARVDWESRLPCVLGPRNSRMSLFTRKQ